MSLENTRLKESLLTLTKRKERNSKI